ncbi:succinate dehydrogenase, cytochrome b556 subunit [Formosimonas limnophila]|uniref:Succinate dehydrogenase cytochrome b556 subunit n=1 Tax=Formosimonas limnophila TaxID=1384487 RepID=A0A8J3CLY7_9BURK|nr:succinate dehydrogenase, cytochrome b556 subunit [Formosimonas limnophila]GHA67541.1 succinate dehydrogenase, cytochrome b556 subunit [Formosimonas limnophila]
MSETPQKAKRPEFRNINVMDIKNYRLPPAGIVSILHRISGAALFLALPLLLCIVTAGFGTAESFAALSSCLAHPLVKIVLLGLIWATLHHACAGVRYLVMDVHVKVSKEGGRQTAFTVLAVSLTLTAVVAAKLFNLF